MNKSELLNRLSDIEWDDFEVKEARSELPKSIWETVSAFANSSGGWIILGVSNPVLARMFRWAKLAENAGFGYDKMLAWKHKVEFDTFIDYSEAAFFLDDKVSDSVEVITPPITELERKLLGIIRQNPTGSRKEFAKELGISTGVIKEYTDKLKQKGVLERKGNNRTGYWEIKKTDN